MSKKRRNHSTGFKAKVTLAAIKGDQSLAEVFASSRGLAPDRKTEI